MIRNGKIARLPRHIRDTINGALYRGIEGNYLVWWLNEKPEVKEALDVWFEGRPITKQNLSEWRKGGYKEWLKRQEACDIVRQLNEKAVALAHTADSEDISHLLSITLMPEFVRVVQTLLDEKTDTERRWQQLQEIFRVLSRVRRADFDAGMLMMERLRWGKEIVKERSSRTAGEKLVPVVNLVLEEMVRKALSMGNHYDQRAEDILNKYFRPDVTGPANTPAQNEDAASVQASPSQSNPVQPSQTEK